jgi:ABC-type branched-subunit amino acid transport system substrate-binding protein
MKRACLTIGGITLAGCLFSSLSFAGLSGAATETSTTPIVVGGEGQNALTPGTAQGFEAGIVRFNNAGGLGGRKIKFLGFLDDGFSPATALTNVQQLVDNDHVFAVVPFNNETATQSVSTFLSQNKTPLIGYGVTPPFVDNPWAWSINGDYAKGATTATTAIVELESALHEKGSQLKFAIPANNGASSVNAVNEIKTAIESSGAKVVYDATNIPPIGTTNYQPYAQAIISSGANAVFDALGNADAIGVTAALQQDGFKGPNLNGVTYFPDSQLAANPSEDAALQGVYISNSMPATEDKTPATIQAIKDLKTVGAPPYLTTGTSIGYWSAQLFISMLKATEAKVGSAAKVTPQAVYKTVNDGYTYTGALKGGLASEKFPYAEHYGTTCYGTLRIEGTKYVDLAPYQCTGKLIPVKPVG